MPRKSPTDPTKIRTPEDALTYLTHKDRAELTRQICGGISRQAVAQWRRFRIPAQHVIRLEHAFGIPRGAMRPDIFYKISGERPHGKKTTK